MTILIGSSEIDVEAQGGNRDRAAVLVVAGIVDVLQIKGSEETAPEMRGVEALEDFLRGVGKAAVAEQEAQPAESQILLMCGDDAVGDEDGARAVVAPVPGIAGREAAELRAVRSSSV